ncbi:hypothetical protein CPSG_05221 [Coccidioides posadasii str. Silveira]|uniref:Uncharacterized protein n=1 Tax=Coccidioides posadasii (strain RMSCC 757 / Silveira) TaxID=443226 RepID=E9D4V3_COCPS|nr:hypothetical protein CPSG_05221 [Coccidioides posadasii str. Silveira]
MRCLPHLHRKNRSTFRASTLSRRAIGIMIEKVLKSETFLRNTGFLKGSRLVQMVSSVLLSMARYISMNTKSPLCMDLLEFHTSAAFIFSIYS